MSGARITVRILPNGDRLVSVRVPIDECVRPAPFVGEPVAQAREVAMEVAMHALARKVEDR